MTRNVRQELFLLGADRLWPQKMFEVAEPIIRKLGGTIVGTEYTAGKETDFSPVIAKIAAQGQGPAVRPAGRWTELHPTGGGPWPPEDHHRGVPRIVRDLSRRLRRQGPEHVRGGAVRRHRNPPAVKVFVAKIKASAGAGVPVSNYVLTHYNR